jgi:hypothetical protein
MNHNRHIGRHIGGASTIGYVLFYVRYVLCVKKKIHQKSNLLKQYT